MVCSKKQRVEYHYCEEFMPDAVLQYCEEFMPDADE
jgi:hypothetical protein